MIRIPESEYDVKQLFVEADRDHYSLDAYTYFWELYDEYRRACFDSSEVFEFDVIAWCCDYYEQSPEEFVRMYDIEVPDDWTEMSKDELTEYVLEALNERTDAISTSEGILCRVF